MGWLRTLMCVAGRTLAVAALSACGMNGDDVRVPAAQLTLLAGSTAGPGNVDGPGAFARFRRLGGIATDHAGNIYVDDPLNGTVRMISPNGEVSSVTGSAGQFDVTDAAGNIYVVDADTIRKITPAGDSSVFAGGVAGYAEGIGSDARFHWPVAVAVDKATGNVYVLDARNNRVRKITAAGEVSTLAGHSRGNADGPGTTAAFWFCESDQRMNYVLWLCPAVGMATDRSGNVYVPDYHNGSIRKITPDGVVSTIAQLDLVHRVATDDAGNVYGTHFRGIVYKIPPGGPAQYLAGQAAILGSADPVVPQASSCSIDAIAVSASGELYIAGRQQPPVQICRITHDGVSVLQLSGIGDGAWRPGGLAVDGASNLSVTDTWQQIIRKITPEGLVSTFAGADLQRGSTDGVGSMAQFASPNGIASDPAGNLYVTDSFNAIRKVDRGAAVSTMAGSAAEPGSIDGPATVARFNRPQGVAADAAGNIYVADTESHTIRKITPEGWVSTLAGSAGQPGSADGTGADARFYKPGDVTADGTGNVYVADSGNHTIRKISSTGKVSTLVGVPGREGFIGGALPGVISAPGRLAVWGSTLYFVTYSGVAMVTDLP